MLHFSHAEILALTGQIRCLHGMKSQNSKSHKAKGTEDWVLGMTGRKQAV
jgi:hypothetical protein